VLPQAASAHPLGPPNRAAPHRRLQRYWELSVQLRVVHGFLRSLIDTLSSLWEAACGYFVDKYDGENGD
jgi:hypothetical protein